IGRRAQLAICAVIISVFSFVGPSLIASGNSGHDAFVIIVFGVLGLSFGQATGTIRSHFSPRHGFLAKSYSRCSRA
ncbi:MFS transporter, partial [Rhizobium leguminosarum]